MPSAINAIPVASNKLYYFYKLVAQGSFSSVYYHYIIFINEAQKAKLKTIAGNISTLSTRFNAVLLVSSVKEQHGTSNLRWDCGSGGSISVHGTYSGVRISISTYNDVSLSNSELDNLPSIDLE